MNDTRAVRLLLSLSVALPARVAGAQTAATPGHGVIVRHPGATLPRPATPQQRRFTKARWDTVIVVPAATLRAFLGKPEQIVATNRQLVIDDAGGRLVSFSLRGKLRWKLDRANEGQLAHIRLSGDTVWALSRGEPRVTVIAPDGTARTFALRGAGTVRATAPASGGGIVACQFAEAPPCDEVAPDGRVGKSIPIQWAGFSRLHPLMRASVIASDPASERWVYALSQGDGWFAYDGTRPQPYVGYFVEHDDYPDVVSDTSRFRSEDELARLRLFALALAVHDSTVSVLFLSSDDHRYIDEYDFRTGRYLRSMRLPQHAFGIAVSGRTYFILRAAPYEVIAVRERKGRR